MAKQRSVPQLKRILDREFSRYIRNFYANGDQVACFTCGKVKPVKEMHCGHYIPRTQSPTRYSESNCRPQCAGCNTFRSGMPHEFRRNLCIEIGEDAVEAMEEESRQPWKWDRIWLSGQIEHYRRENESLSE